MPLVSFMYTGNNLLASFLPLFVVGKSSLSVDILTVMQLDKHALSLVLTSSVNYLALEREWMSQPWLSTLYSMTITSGLSLLAFACCERLMKQNWVL